MRMPAPYKCDVCGRLKDESNHWWLRMRTENEKQPPALGAFLLEPWDPDVADKQLRPECPLYEHICSESCAMKSLSQYMARQQPKQQAELPRVAAELLPLEVMEVTAPEGRMVS